MDDVDVSGGSDAKFPIAFGDFRRGHLLVDRVGMRIVVDYVTTLGSTRFYISKRRRSSAIKWIKTAA
jgi:HK97 family phage major capsid protein